MGLFDALKGNEFKVLAKEALNRLSLDGEKLSSFIPYLLVVNKSGNIEELTCVSATNETSQDMAYDMAYEMRNQDPSRIEKYAIVFVGNYDSENENKVPIIAECGIADKEDAVLYGIYYKEGEDGILKKTPGIFKLRETANALINKKTFASRTVLEGGGSVTKYISSLPIVLAYLTAFESGNFSGSMPEQVWEIYKKLLNDWSERGRSIGYIISGLSLKALTDNNVLSLMPREGVNKDTLKSSLHVGNQMLIEGVKSGQLDLNDLKLTMGELNTFVKKVAEIIGMESQSESLSGLCGFLETMTNDPLSLSET